MLPWFWQDPCLLDREMRMAFPEAERELWVLWYSGTHRTWRSDFTPESVPGAWQSDEDG